MSLFGKFATVGGATLISRLLGFVREVMIAASLGAGPIADVFYAAFRFPNLFRRLFAEGAFNSAFIPLFAKELEGGGRGAARRFVEDVLGVLLISLIALTAFAELFMPMLVDTVIAPHFDENKASITVELTRVMFPYLFAMSLAAMLSGILNAFRHYFLAAIVPAALNVILIAALVLSIILGATPLEVGRYLAWGVFVAGFVQLALLFVGIRNTQFHFALKRPVLSPAVKRLLVLAAPVAITGGITQINLIIGQIIASAQDGAIAVLSYADRIYQLPLGVIGIAIGVVLLPELARALKAENRNTHEAERLQNRSFEFALGLSLPAAVGLAILPHPIISVLFERGAFTAATTGVTAQVLTAFAWGLPAFVLIKVFTPGFFAREDMRTPMWFAGTSVIINIIGSVLLFPPLGPVGIAIATAIASWVNATLLATTLARRRQFSLTGDTVRTVAMMMIASALMGALIYVALGEVSGWLSATSILVRAATLLLIITLGMATYFFAVIATGAIDRRSLRSILRRGE